MTSSVNFGKKILRRRAKSQHCRTPTARVVDDDEASDAEDDNIPSGNTNE